MASPPSSETSTNFDATYWEERSAYSKFGSYEDGLLGLQRSHAGIWRLLAPHLPAPGRHVDAGCGHGYFVFEMTARGWDSFGFDPSEWTIEQAQLHEPALADRFATGMLDQMPFEGDFDLVTCFEVLEHVPDPVSDLRALAGRLKPGGRLIASTPNRRPLMPWPDAVAADPTHISVHDASWWLRALEAAGFSSCHVSTYLTWPLTWRLHPSLSRWMPFGSKAGPSVLMVADL